MSHSAGGKWDNPGRKAIVSRIFDYRVFKISAPINSFLETVFPDQTIACPKPGLGISRHSVIFLTERCHLLDGKFPSGDTGSIYHPR